MIPMHATTPHPPRPPVNQTPCPLLIAEGLHVLNSTVHQAIVERDAPALSRLARSQLASGASAMAVNLGPGREMARRAPWVLDTLLENTRVPLFVSAGILSSRESLRRAPERLIVNAVTADPEELEAALRIAGQCGTGLVVLLVRPGLTPAGVEDRLQLAGRVLDLAGKTGFPPERLYLDPVLGCRPDPLAWKISRGMPGVGTVAESIAMIRQLSPEVNTLVSLGIAGMGISGSRRTRLQCSMLSVLSAAGLDAVIVNSLNRELMEAAHLDPKIGM